MSHRGLRKSLNDTEIYHIYNGDDIIEHDTDSLECVCGPEASIECYRDENGNKLDEHFLLIKHQVVVDEFKEDSFISKVLKALSRM